MQTTTAIVPAQNSVSGIVPKPTKNDLIEALVRSTIEKREAENIIRQAKLAKIKVQFDKALEAFKKTKITLGDLPAAWANAGAHVYISSSIRTSPRMQELHREMRALQDLPTSIELVRKEVQDKLKKETMDAIMNQPGVKEVLRSTVLKLGL